MKYTTMAKNIPPTPIMAFRSRMMFLARKASILARKLGFRGQRNDIRQRLLFGGFLSYERSKSSISPYFRLPTGVGFLAFLPQHTPRTIIMLCLFKGPMASWQRYDFVFVWASGKIIERYYCSGIDMRNYSICGLGAHIFLRRGCADVTFLRHFFV